MPDRLTSEAERSGTFEAGEFEARAREPAKCGTEEAKPKSMAHATGSSEALCRVYSIVDRISGCDSTVLITGESGTGKELVARAVHETSQRATGPMVVVNCGAIPEPLLESEMFGHVRGAFTGAHQSRLGRVGAARGGTLLLDEIGELPLALQVKLLRLLQQREYSPVGDNRTIEADVRVVAATNRDLEQEVVRGAFREDLYYRLNVIHLRVPALRERAEDVPALAEHFLREACKRVGRSGVTLSPEAMAVLVNWDWPGNVRELENTIERAVVFTQGGEIRAQDLPRRMLGLRGEAQTSARLPEAGVDLRAAVEAYENDLIRQALDRTGWNKNRAALLLGLNRTTLVEMLKRKRLAGRVA